MHGMRAELVEARTLRDRLAQGFANRADVMLCAPATLVAALAGEMAGSRVAVGGQDCHMAAAGAHTGDISAAMLADAGATAVIVGHSERRTDHGETDAQVRAKAEAALRSGLTAIVCIGETAGERRDGATLAVVSRQLEGSVPAAATAASVVVAYEPVWAIGTGLTPTAQDVAEVHGQLRAALVRRFGDDGAVLRILYGGSVKPANARDLLAIANVDGALVGGASLKAADFLGIIAAYEAGA